MVIPPARRRALVAAPQREPAATATTCLPTQDLAHPQRGGWNRLSGERASTVTGPAAPRRELGILATRLANTRVARLLHCPSTLALDEIERFLGERSARTGAASREETTLRRRVGELRDEVAKLPKEERLERVAQEIFFGRGFPEFDARTAADYREARRSWAANLLGALGALSNPLTAALLPLAIKGGWDVGRLAQPLPHFMSDEWPTALLHGLYEGTTPTAHASAASYLEYWRHLLARQGNDELTVLQSYVISGLPHHVFEGTKDDLMNTNPFNDSQYLLAMSKLPAEALVAALPGGTKVAKLAAPAAGLANPFAALFIGAATSMSAGLYEQFPAHRAEHRTRGDMSLLELALQATGWVSSRAEHAEHHKANHDTKFSGSTRWVDRIFDEGGVSDLLNLLAYARTQGEPMRIIPTSWSRDPSRLEALVGEPLPLDQARGIAAAKQGLMSAHATLRGLSRSLDVHALLAKTLSDPSEPRLEPLRAVFANPQLKSLLRTDMTVLDAYRALREATDGVTLTADTVAAVLTGAPIEEKFVRELSPQTPSSAWPTLTDAQIRRAVTRLRDAHEPGRNPREPEPA
jgi:hypothetical protein